MDISKNISSVKIDDSLILAACKIIPTLEEARRFVSRWTITGFETEMTSFVSKLDVKNVSELKETLKEYCKLREITPGVILLIRGTFLFYIDEIERLQVVSNVSFDDKRFSKIWDEVYKIVILNISLCPAEWTKRDPKICLEWKEDFSKYGIQKERFQSFVDSVQKTL